MAVVQVVERLSHDTATKVTGLWDAKRAGALDEPGFVRRSAHVVNRANARATATADQAVAADLRRQTGQPIRPAGIRPINDQGRLETAIRKVIGGKPGDTDDPDVIHQSRRSRLGRLARNEPATAAQNTTQRALEHHQGILHGWVRMLGGSDSCPLCTKWADGKVRSTRVPMNRHHNCRCMQRPVAKTGTREAKAKTELVRRRVKQAAVPLAAGAAIVATPVDEIALAAFVRRLAGAATPRTMFLAGGPRAYRNLIQLEGLLKEGGPALDAAKAEKRRLAVAGVDVERNVRDLEVLDGGFLTEQDIYGFLDDLKTEAYTAEELDALWDYAGVLPYEGRTGRLVLGKGPVDRYNNKLRRGDPFTAEEQETIRLVDQAIARNTTKRDAVVWRGSLLPDEAVEKIARAKPGQYMVDKSYQFTGLTESRAWPHAAPDAGIYEGYHGVMFKLRVPKGMPAIHSPYGEALATKSRRRRIPGLTQVLGPGGRQIEVPLNVITRPLIPKRLTLPPSIANKTIRIRVRFLEYFNREELVLPRNTAIRIISTGIREDGLLQVEAEVILPTLSPPAAPAAGRIVGMAKKPIERSLGEVAAQPGPRLGVPAPVKPVPGVKGAKRRVHAPGAGPAMHPDLIADDKVADTIRRQARVPGFEDLAKRTDRSAFEEIMRRQVRFILQSAERSWGLSPEATRAHAGWYPFANRWLTALAETNPDNGITPAGAYATTAALSPRSLWANNVAWAKRVIEAVSEDVEVNARWINTRYDVERKAGRAAGRKAGPPQRRNDLIGKRLSEIEKDEDVAYVLRAWHDHEPLRQLGGASGFGDSKNIAAPNDMVNLTKAVSVARNGSLENIDRTLGGMKVRSFYNNLANPFDDVDLNVTIDTHHYGVANGFPWVSTDRFTSSGADNITDSPWSGASGIGGTYSLVVEATRRATAIFNELHGTNFLPNQLQSVVWEQHQGDYPSSYRKLDLLARMERIRTARAKRRITEQEEDRLIETARLLADAPKYHEILAWYLDDLAGRPRRTLTELRKRRR